MSMRDLRFVNRSPERGSTGNSAMLNRRAYARTPRLLSPWALKAVGLVIAGAATMIVVVTIARAVSLKSDSPRDGKFVGVRHDAATVSSPGSAVLGNPVPSSAQTPQAATDTIVRNGVTVVSPQLLVPVINIDALETATGAEADTSSSKVSKPQKRGRYANRAHWRRQTRWKAYGFAFR